MAREVKTVEIATGGRDDGKIFLIIEKPAMEAERIATFAIMAAVRGGAAISPDMGMSAFETLRSMSLASLALMPAEAADYVFGKMMECVTIQRAAAGAPDMETPRRIGPNDIEEIDTIYLLRKHVLELHISFLERLNRLISVPQTPKAADASPTM